LFGKFFQFGKGAEGVVKDFGEKGFGVAGDVAGFLFDGGNHLRCDLKKWNILHKFQN